jgi:hypothetical protein
LLTGNKEQLRRDPSFTKYSMEFASECSDSLALNVTPNLIIFFCAIGPFSDTCSLRFSGLHCPYQTGTLPQGPAQLAHARDYAIWDGLPFGDGAITYGEDSWGF